MTRGERESGGEHEQSLVRKGVMLTKGAFGGTGDQIPSSQLGQHFAEAVKNLAKLRWNRDMVILFR